MILTFVTLIGLIFRLIYSNQSFWLDEGASLMFAKLSIPQLFESIKTDFHPPIFYGLLHFCLPLAGKSEWLIRLPFILFSTATIPALYYLCRTVFGQKSKIPLLSAVFLALNPLHIYYSQELRMYSLATLLVILSWYFLVRKNYFLAGVFNLLGFFTFYGVIFNIVSQMLFLFFGKSKRKYLDITSTILPTVLFFILWWPIFSTQLGNGHYLQNILPGWQALSGALTLKSLFLIPLKFIFGRISFQPQNLYLMVGGVMTLLFFLISYNSFRDKKARLFWFALLTPLILATVVSLKTPLLGYWRFIFVLPFFMVILAAGIEDMPRIIFWGTAIWVCGVFLFSNLYFWHNPRFHREDWRGLAAFVGNKKASLFLAFPYRFAPLNFYLTDTPVIPMQTPKYELKRDFPTNINGQIKNMSVVFYLDYLADLTDPQRKGLKSLPALNLKQKAVYNFNNLGQLYEFQPL